MGCVIGVGLSVMLLGGSSANAQTDPNSAVVGDTPFSGNDRLAPNGGFTVHEWISNARFAHNEWNNKAFTPSGDNVTPATEEDFLTELYVAVVETFFDEISTYLKSLSVLIGSFLSSVL